jgi:hypothetical protein
MQEVVAFEEEGLTPRCREGVREAIAVIQACTMASFSKAAERAARHFAVFYVDCAHSTHRDQLVRRIMITQSTSW